MSTMIDPLVQAEAGESTPLIVSETGLLSADNNNDDEPPPLQEMKAETLKERAVTIFAVAGTLTSAVTLFFLTSMSNPTLYVSSLLGVLISPFCALQQRKLTQVEALKQTNQRFEEEVADLSSTHARLTKQVQSLHEEVLKLETLEETLQHLKEMETTSLDDLRNQVNASRDILNSMQLDARANLLQQLMLLIVANDIDQDWILDPDEVDNIIQQLENIHGVQLHADKLKEICSKHEGSIETIMELIRHVMLDDTDGSDENPVFKFIKSTK